MDICAFINSQDISDYLREIDYKFNSLEVAWLIYQCDKLTWDEKKAAWNELIETMPDCEVPERSYCKYYPSLHDMLRRYMALLDREIENFYRLDEREVYFYSVDAGNHFIEGNHFDQVFLSVDEIWKDFDDMDFKDFDISKINIEKRIPGQRYHYMIFNEKKEPMEIVIFGELLSEEEDDLYSSFNGFWLEFPVPFEKGDVVVGLPKNCLGFITQNEDDPFVLEWCAGFSEVAEKESHIHGKCGDNAEMKAWGFFQDYHGVFDYEDMSNYMNLVYYKGPLTGRKRVLKAVSNFLKGKIGLDLLLCAYRKMLLDIYADDCSFQQRWYKKEELELAGLIDTEEEV